MIKRAHGAGSGNSVSHRGGGPGLLVVMGHCTIESIDLYTEIEFEACHNVSSMQNI